MNFRGGSTVNPKREEVRDVSETSERAQARLEAWDFAASYLAHLVDATRMIDSEELNQVMEEAEGRALDERANAAESLEEPRRGCSVKEKREWIVALACIAVVLAIIVGCGLVWPPE